MELDFSERKRPLPRLCEEDGRMTLKNILSKPIAAGCTVGLILLAGTTYSQPLRAGAPRLGDGSGTAGARSGRLADVAAHAE